MLIDTTMSHEKGPNIQYSISPCGSVANRVTKCNHVISVFQSTITLHGNRFYLL